MMIFKRKQIVVLSLVLMIIVAGYLQYSYKRSSVSVNDKDNGKLGEAVYVDNMNLSDDAEAKKNDENNTKDQKSTEASKEANDYFAQAKLDREISLSKDSDSLKAITEDDNASSEVKAQAYDQMMTMLQDSQVEANIETLVVEKGFNDVIALLGADGSVDIVVKTPSLTSEDVAQISDIASRQAQVDLTQIHVRNIY